MLFWDFRIQVAQVQDRLKHLPTSTLSAYVVGCVTHAHEVIRPNVAEERRPVFTAISEFLAKFWLDYPHILHPGGVQTMLVGVSDLLPDEEGGADAWEDTLLWGLAYAFSFVSRQDYTDDALNEAISSVDCAYWAIFNYWHKLGPRSSEDDLATVEKNSPFCRAEIEFQLALLALLEASDNPPPSYASLLKRIAPEL